MNVGKLCCMLLGQIDETVAMKPIVVNILTANQRDFTAVKIDTIAASRRCAATDFFADRP